MTPTNDVTFGLDLSNHQPGLNLAKAKAEGFDFTVAKCTEGDFFADPLYNDFRAQAMSAGMLFAAYALIHRGNGARQADWIAAHVGDLTIPVMVDFEPMSGSSPTMADLRAFMRRARRRGLKVTLNYLPHWYWQQIGSPNLKGTPSLIQSAYPNQTHDHASAVYPGNGHSAWAPMGGVVPTIWQFTDNGKLDSYGAGIDMDAFRGTRAELAALGLFKDYAHRPPKRPKPPVPTPIPAPPKHAPKPAVKHTRRFHIVKRGDTLGAIANEHGLKLEDVYSLNRFRHPFLRRNATRLHIGWKVRVR